MHMDEFLSYCTAFFAAISYGNSINRQWLHGVNVLLRYICRISSMPGFYGRDAYQTTKVLFLDE